MSKEIVKSEGLIVADLVSTSEAAKILDIKPTTLRKWRERKLFGCPFFAADVKRGKNWYYERERVLQLKSVYQKGVLADLVKLSKENANIFLHEGHFTDSTIVTGKKFCVTRCGQHHGLFSVDDVSRIFSVTQDAVYKWVQRGELRWDKYDHANKWLFRAEDIEAFAARRKKTTPAVKTQQLENLPQELLTQPRFFKLGKTKTSTPKGWSNPDNQTLYTNINGNAGFDICGHQRGVDYLFLDFDHVLDDNGQFVNDDAKHWFNFVHSTLKGYCELSISGHGLHILAKPTPNKFKPVSNGKNGVLFFDRNNDVKLELFFKPKARYCLFTGNLFQCDAGAPIADAKTADTVFQALLDEIQHRNNADKPAKKPKREKQSANSPVQAPQSHTMHADTPDYDLYRAEKMLACIDPARLSDSDWLAVNSAAKNIGVPYSTVDTFNQRDPERYNEAENQSRWNSLNDPSFDIRTLHGIAQQFGYDEKSTQREWYQLHPETANISNPAPSDNDPLKKELREIGKALAAFDTEKDTALETLHSVEKFDSDTVFADDIVIASAFAQLFDKQAFSDFRRNVKTYGDKHKDQKADLNSWLAAVRSKAKEINSRRAGLVTRRNEITAQLKSLAFVAKNDLLANIVIPKSYSVSAERGIEKVEGERIIPVCRRPVIISGKSFSVDEKIYKLSISFLRSNGKWKTISPTERAVLSNRNKIVDLANDDLPVTTENSRYLVEYLDDFQARNEDNFPLTYSVARCGWYSFSGQDYFVDPRRNCIVTDGDKDISVEVDSNSTFANSLRSVGSLEEWKKAYQLAKKSPVARFIVAAAVAPPLLKVLGERNFLLYIYAPTLAGKTTALYLAASAVGDEKIIRSFDATKNGLAGAAADVNDYPFLIDEKQVADNRLKECFSDLVYALANGVGRTKLNRDSSLKKVHDWRTIPTMTGETLLLPDNVTGGANTRLLTISERKKILDADTCKVIRNTIKDNYGHAFPLVVDKIIALGTDNLRGWYQGIVDTFTNKYPDLLPEYCRYMAVLTLADALLNSALGTRNALADATRAAQSVFPLIPTTAEISDTAREKELVRGFIAQNQNRFIGGNVAPDKMQAVYGILNADDGYTYIAVKALREACANDGFDYKKLVDDLVADKFFTPAETLAKGRKTPLSTVTKWLGEVKTRCYRIPTFALQSDS